MSWLASVLRPLAGSEPRMQRMLGYWAATGLLYVMGLLLILRLIDGGIVAEASGTPLIRFGLTSLVGGYLLIRCSSALGLRPAQLAVLQSLLALTCNVGAYALMGPVRGAALMVLLVTIVFSTFSLGTRATLTLCLVVSVELGITMLWMTAAYPDRYPARIEAVHFSLTVASLLSVSLLTGEMHKLRARLKRQKEELLVAVATIRTLATMDELTALANRRHMNEVLGAEERRAALPGRRVCIGLIDIDFFKQINDRHGHAGGDSVLRAFAAAIRGQLREADVLARWGGEEFLILLPDTGLGEATRVLARMADQVRAMRIDDVDGALRVTFSAGIAERSAEEPFTDTISRADRAMYLAKSTGRNRIVPAGGPEQDAAAAAGGSGTACLTPALQLER